MHTRCNFGRSKLDLSKKLLTVPKSLWIKKIFPTFDLSLQNVSIFGKLLHYWLVHWVAWRCFGKSGHEILGRHGYGRWGNKHCVQRSFFVQNVNLKQKKKTAVCFRQSAVWLPLIKKIVYIFQLLVYNSAGSAVCLHFPAVSWLRFLSDFSKKKLELNFWTKMSLFSCFFYLIIFGFSIPDPTKLCQNVRIFPWKRPSNLNPIFGWNETTQLRYSDILLSVDFDFQITTDGEKRWNSQFEN